MKQTDNRGALNLTKKGLCIAVGSLLGLALTAWVLLVIGIFRKDKKEREAFSWTPPVYDIPAVPEGYKLEFKLKKGYTVSNLGKKTVRYSIEYDKKGNELLRVTYDAEGKEEVRIECTYNDQGRKIKEVTTNGSDAVEKETRIYDQNGNLTECTREFRDTELSFVYAREAYQYDENGIISNAKYYDTDGNVVEEIDYYPSGKKRRVWKKLFRDWQTEKFYDEDEKILKVLESINDKTSVQEEFRYSEDGLILEEIRYPGQENEGRTIYSYDENGVLTQKEEWKYGEVFEETYYRDGALDTVYKYLRDGSRYVSYLTEYDENGVRTAARYFDANGKETKRITYSAGGRYSGEWGVGRSGELVPKFLYDYDEDGYLIRYVLYEDGDIREIQEFEYEQERWADRKTVFTGAASKTAVKGPDGALLYTIFREFNGDNISIKEFYYKPDGSLYYSADDDTGYNGYESEYDDYGNKIRTKEYHFGIADLQWIYEYEPFAVPVTKE